MALKSPYLAAENSAQVRRSRALHRFMVATPIALVLTVGAIGHMRPRPYARPSSDGAYDRQVLAFRDRVAAAQSMTSLEGTKPTAAALRQEAERWLAGFRSGALRPVRPAMFEDHLRDGVRGEILRSGTTVAALLNLDADEEVARGGFAQAARDAVAAARLGHELRGFEVQSYLQCMLVERRALITLGRAWMGLSPAQRDGIRPALKSLIVDPQEVDALARQEQGQYEDYLRRRQIVEVPEPRLGADAKLEDQALETTKRSASINVAHLRALLAPNGKPLPSEPRRTPVRRTSPYAGGFTAYSDGAFFAEPPF